MKNTDFIDKDDYNRSNRNSNNDKIKEEIKFLEGKVEEIEQENLNHLMRLKETANRIDNDSNIDIKKYDIDCNNGELQLQRYDNLINQICSLQIKQFAESICGVKKYKKTNEYLVKFDPSKNMKELSLSSDNYTKLIKHRDQFNSISVYDLLQEKIFSYYNTNTTGNDAQSSSKKEAIDIGKKIKIHYNYCHNCKQRKPAEVMLQCKNHQQNTSRLHKTYYINGTTVIRRNKSMIIRHFEGDPKEYIDNMDYYDEVNECRRYFCHFCLKGSYDIILDYIKNKKDWLCPYCTGICFCSRCTRNDKILKLIGLYVSVDGDLSILYDSLITESIVLDKLNMNMVLSNIIVLINDPALNPKETIANIAKTEVKDMEKINSVLTKCEDYKSNLNQIKEYFETLFTQARIDKSLLHYDKLASLPSSFEDDDQESSASSFLLKKTNRSQLNYDVTNNNSSINKKGMIMQKELQKEFIPSPLRRRIIEPKILETFKIFAKQRGRPRKNSE